MYPDNRTLPLTPAQRESLGLINIGTFLEYFDFKVYIHLTVVLNVLFFPKTDVYAQSLLMVLSFSMAYVLRPVGSLIFGFFGDLWGRKTNIIITTLMMAVATFIMACMPTYDQIGWKASVAILVCRAIQGVASGVEIIGAIIYTSELVQAPRSYFYSAFIGAAAECGTLFSLFICTIFMALNPEDGWRYVCFVGSAIAVVGSLARTRLKESPEFLKAINKIKNQEKRKEIIFKSFSKYKKNIFNFFLLELRGPFLFFLSFVSLSKFLEVTYGFTGAEVIRHNLYIALISFLSYISFVMISRRVHPLKLLKIIGFILLIVSLSLPYLIGDNASVIKIFIIQAIIASLNITGVADAIFARGFSIIGRYTVMGVSYSLARAIAAVGTSYGCVVVASMFGFMGISILMAVIMSLHLIGLYCFKPSDEDQRIAKEWKTGY